MYRHTLLAALLSLCTIPSTVAEPEPSNSLKQTQCKFQDHTDVTVQYGSMRVEGRKIFGGTVPFGEAWTMGSAPSPTFVAGSNLVVGGKEVPAGKYSMFAVPNPDKWTLVIRKMPAKPGENQTDEVARIDLTVGHLRSPIENFTISFDQVHDGCLMNLRWEETEASVLLAEKKQNPAAK